MATSFRLCMSLALKEELATGHDQVRHPIIDRDGGATSHKTPPVFSGPSEFSDGGQPEIQQPHHQPLPRIVLRLRAVGWSDEGNRSYTDIGGLVASVALDLSVDHGNRYPGEEDHGANDYWLFANFDDGTVRLWQVRDLTNASTERRAPEVMLFTGGRRAR